MTDVDPVKSVRDAFSASGFAADVAAEADQAPPAAPKIEDEARRRKAEKMAYVRRMAKKHGDNFARVVGRGEGLSAAEIDEALSPAPKMRERKTKTDGAGGSGGAAGGDRPEKPSSPPAADDGGEGGWTRKRDPIKPLGEDCPVRALGRAGKTFVYLTATHQVETLRAQDHNANGLRSLFGQRIDFLWQHWPKFNERDRMQTGWKADAATESLMFACDQRGVFDLFDVVRGVGGWLARDGSLIIHAGDAVWIDGEWRPPGEYGGHIYPSFPAAGAQTKASNPAPATCSEPLLAHFDRWNWRGPDDWRNPDGSGHHMASILLLGHVGASMAGAALRWRPSVWITGDAGDGKSTLQECIEAVHAGGLVKSSDATAAGIWSVLGASSRPVLIDEGEPDPTSNKMKKVIEFARLAPSGGIVLRGSADQTSASFRVQSSFLFGSIIVPPLLPQDLTRFCILELAPLTGRKGMVVETDKLAAMGAGIRARLIAQWSRWPEALTAWRADLEAAGCSPRQQDQYGTLLAMYDLLTGDEAMPADMRRDLAAPFSASRLDADAHVPTNAEAMLSFFLSTPIEVFRGGNRQTVRTVLEAAVPVAPADGQPHPVTAAAAREALREHGIIVSGPPAEAMIGLPNQHAALARIFEQSQWRGEPGASGGWSQAMKRLGGAMPVNGRNYGGRGWVVPAKSILGDYMVSLMRGLDGEAPR
jgi:hypothetical protein